MAWEAPIAGSGEGYIQTAGTSLSEGQMVRSADRERAAREFNPTLATTKTAAQLKHQQWIAEAKAEEDKKQAERAEKIRTGKLVIHPDGGYTEKL
jgi:hypothetical protein